MNQIKTSLDFFEPNQRLTIKKEFDVNKVEKILVQGIDQLGGLAMSSPFFRELRKAFPQAYIVNLVGPLTYGIMKNCPYIDDVWLFHKKESFKVAKRIKKIGFDLTFLAAGSLRAALIAYLGKIPNRVGFDNDGTGRLLTIQLHMPLHSRYRPENMFDMLRAIGISPKGVYDREIWISGQDIEYGEAWAEVNKPQGTKIFAFNPFSTDPKRRWTNKGWQELLQGLKAIGIKSIMMVAPNEVEGSKKLLQEWQQEDVPIQTHSVTNTAAVLEHVDFVMGPESGFIHMALATKKAHVIALFNVLPPQSTFPVHDKRHVGLIRDDLHCAPCYLYKFKDQCPYNLECMSGIDSKRVLDAIDTFSKSDELDATSK
ncbi:glycosyltransferase family 9 protein [Thiomicrorhabdus sp. Milos-T2]|uniref:glycosyltransferase family 9 protein n=1 Tax=Thiomicrorhabdus sp. Milos-T2 TaxID=90814 RepID=UPI000494268D|nr:glycosyltransferase family 9 protein [Thiomicrorhabdus sp. Milos-T2]